MKVEPVPRLRMLVAYASISTHVKTTYDYLMSLTKYTDFEVEYLNVVGASELDFDLNRYDIVFVNYCARLVYQDYVSPKFVRSLENWRGLKVLSVQDEYDATNKLILQIKRIHFDLVLTCIPENIREQIYPQTDFPNTTFIQVLTGYVPEDIDIHIASLLPIEQRNISVGYRGRDIGPRYGKLGRQKYEIGVTMRSVCQENGLSYDIEVDEESRIYGDDWYRFIASCQTMLGTESGSNVFDLDGQLEAKLLELKANANLDCWGFDVASAVTQQYETGDSMGQISPRIFECASLKTALVLFPGRYSDVLVPNKHYIPLAADFSNIANVIDRINDKAELERIAQRTWEDLVRSEKYSYVVFAKNIAAHIVELAAARSPTIKNLELNCSAQQNSLHLSPLGDVVYRPEPIPLSDCDVEILNLFSTASVFIKDNHRLSKELKTTILATAVSWQPHRQNSDTQPELLMVGIDVEGVPAWHQVDIAHNNNDKLDRALSAIQKEGAKWVSEWGQLRPTGFTAGHIQRDRNLKLVANELLRLHELRYWLLIEQIKCVEDIRSELLATVQTDKRFSLRFRKLIRQFLIAFFGEPKVSRWHTYIKSIFTSVSQ